ncbi:hypothetical protein OE88DRAFT_1644666 [Heliocybe sulcata]|uniref:Uncharacterized protein n=1 Tax=Heliocybe sulcata TaxID=5364 RepID=A0A5C3N507_9AGAM|nr:hypothetical protein OE88DRAFT_1644666 [Heliocybe sulcata]
MDFSSLAKLLWLAGRGGCSFRLAATAIHPNSPHPALIDGAGLLKDAWRAAPLVRSASEMISLSDLPAVSAFRLPADGETVPRSKMHSEPLVKLQFPLPRLFASTLSLELRRCDYVGCESHTFEEALAKLWRFEAPNFAQPGRRFLGDWPYTARLLAALGRGNIFWVRTFLAAKASIRAPPAATAQKAWFRPNITRNPADVRAPDQQTSLQTSFGFQKNWWVNVRSVGLNESQTVQLIHELQLLQAVDEKRHALGANLFL